MEINYYGTQNSLPTNAKRCLLAWPRGRRCAVVQRTSSGQVIYSNMLCPQLALFLLALLALCQADTLVQLHVNRPYNDVNEKFVSFAVKPEDLYDALDGKSRKAVTSMAALLGDAYVKFIGDFYFASNAPQRLRNPTKIIWKGFNRWTRYAPDYLCGLAASY